MQTPMELHNMDSQPLVRTMLQSFTKNFCRLLSKYTSKRPYITNVNDCDKLIPWSSKILANIITFLNKIMRTGNNVPSRAWYGTQPKLT